MLKEIIKRDGRIIPYDESKITEAIFNAAKAAAVKEHKIANREESLKLTNLVSEELEKIYENKIPMVEDIQEIVIKILIKAGHAKTSVEYILYRDRRNKIRNAKSQLMQSIEQITNADAVDSDIKRENANIDGNTAMGTMLQYGSTISREFCESYILRPEIADAHRNGDIHIHDMDFLNMGTLTCCQINLSKLFKNGFSTGHGFLREPQDIATYAALAAIAIQSNQNDQHGGQSIPMFDYDMADGVKKTFKALYTANISKSLRLNGVINFDKNEYKVEIIDKLDLRLKLSEDDRKIEADYLSGKYHISRALVDTIQKFSHEESCVETEKKTYQAMEGLIHNLNTMHSRAGAQVPFSSINYGTDISDEGRMVSRNLMLAQERGLGNGETPIFPILIFKVKEGINYNTSDPNYDLFKLACRVSAKRLFPNFAFIDAPYNLKYYVPGIPNTEVAYMGCRTRVLANNNGKEIVDGRGNISFTTINLVRLGIKHGIHKNAKPNLDNFFKDLDETLNLVTLQLFDRLKIQGSKRVKNFPFLMGQGVWQGSEELDPNDTLEEVIKQGTLTTGFIGLAECLVALIGKHHGEDLEAQKLGLKIIGFIRDKMDVLSNQHKLNFSVIATPAEGLSGRFTRIDKKQYGEIPGITDHEYYTNSFHIPVHYKISAFDKIKLEAPYHELTNAGHISYVEVDGDPTNNLEAFQSIIRCMKESGIGYGSINHPIDRDPICGYTGVIDKSICPNCGRDEDDGYGKFDRIRRITGYLVGTVERFNNAKAAELKDRVKHG